MKGTEESSSVPDKKQRQLEASQASGHRGGRTVEMVLVRLTHSLLLCSWATAAIAHGYLWLSRVATFYHGK